MDKQYIKQHAKEMAGNCMRCAQQDPCRLCGLKSGYACLVYKQRGACPLRKLLKKKLTGAELAVSFVNKIKPPVPNYSTVEEANAFLQGYSQAKNDIWREAEK